MKHLLFLILPFSCFAQTRHDFTHPQMGTVFRLVVYADSTVADRAAREAFARVDALNNCLSDYLPDSETNLLCKNAGTWTPVSDDLWNMLAISKDFSKKTGGAFDVTVGPITRLWRRARHRNELPSDADVKEASEKTGYQNIRMRRRGKKILLRKQGMQLDFGGIAQGYAADECLKILKNHGITRALADAGGDIALGDPPPGEEGWSVEVPGGMTKGPYGMTKGMTNCGITTSGATYRYLELNGVRYSHIVDPRTGRALTHRVLVTVQAPDAVTADVWATALSVLGAEGWENLKKKHPELTVLITESNLSE
ncbi:MAG: FAD:protein FMN transferase [Saprospiraceae bacterium]|nr:FAD:protein FMN transferase [Saprospiraceae bacterium]